MKAYKFRTPAQLEFAIDIILNHRIRCSPWKDLNDPMEGMYEYTSGPDDRDAVAKIVKGIGNAKKKYRVGCLSETFDNNLMWSHYADGYRGFVIEVELPNNSEAVQPMWYRSTRYAGVDFATVGNHDDAAREILLSKHKDWGYEREIRVFSNNEWFILEKPVIRVITGPRISDASFAILKAICRTEGVDLAKAVIERDEIRATPWDRNRR